MGMKRRWLLCLVCGFGVFNFGQIATVYAAAPIEDYSTEAATVANSTANTTETTSTAVASPAVAQETYGTTKESKESKESLLKVDDTSKLSIENRVKRLEQQVNFLNKNSVHSQLENMQQKVQKTSGDLEVQQQKLEQLEKQLNSFYTDLDQRLKNNDGSNSSRKDSLIANGAKGKRAYASTTKTIDGSPIVASDNGEKKGELNDAITGAEARITKYAKSSQMSQISQKVNDRDRAGKEKESERVRVAKVNKDRKSTADVLERESKTTRTGDISRDSQKSARKNVSNSGAGDRVRGNAASGVAVSSTSTNAASEHRVDADSNDENSATNNADIPVDLNLKKKEAALREQQAYQLAFNYLQGRQFNDGAQALKKYLATYPSGIYAANAHYWLGEIYFLNNSYAKASSEFDVVATKHASSPKVPEAMFKLAYIHDKEGKHEQAQKEYMKLKKRYPNSAAAKLAEQQLHIN